MDTSKPLDCRDLKCPMPIVKVAQAIGQIEVGAELRIEATDPAFLPDIRAWAEMTGHQLVAEEDGPVKRVRVRKSGP